VGDDAGGSNRGVSGILASPPAGTTLSEEVPALVEQDLDRPTSIEL
jgi:hypothetical protein